MRITALKGRLGPWGDNEQDDPLELSGTRWPVGSGARAHGIAADIAEAVHRDHACEDHGCDVREAAENGYPYSAAALLVGATETDYTERVMRLYRVSANPFVAPDWDAWATHHATWGRRCAACGSYTYAAEDWEPTQCANCLATLDERCDVCHRVTDECDCHDVGSTWGDADNGIPWSDLTGHDTGAYVHVHIVMRDDKRYSGYSDMWAVPDALRDILHVDVTSQNEDEFGMGIPVRDVILSGWVDAATLARFRDEWGIDPDNAEPASGFLGAITDDNLPRLWPDERHTPHPMDFNVGGVTPVLDVTLSIIGPDAHPA